MLFGNTSESQHYIAINTIIMHAKFFIYYTSRQERIPTLKEFINYFSNIYEIDKAVAKSRDDSKKFEKIWIAWSNIFAI